MRRSLVMVCGILCLTPGMALAAGGPVPAIQGQRISEPGATVSYVAVSAGRDTVLRRLHRGNGRLERSVRLTGRFGVARVANDGSTSGLSADGRVLVLAGMTANYPPRRSTLVVVSARRLVVRARIVLPGFYTVDGISPTGRWLYLIHYVAPKRDALRYEVRAYDVPGRRLMRKPVIDPTDHGEAMLGVAVTRKMSQDGRWAYTLYDRPGSTPFIHALDTARRVAVCVDLPAISEQDVFSARLSLTDGGGTLRVLSSGIPVALVNTRTFMVAVPSTHVSRGAHTSSARPTRTVPDSGNPWLLPTAALVVLVAVMLTRGRRRRKTTPAPV